MKKFLKIFICFVMLFSAIAFVGCGEDDETPEERRLRLYDYDSSGVVDLWEEPFEEKATIETSEQIPGYEMIDISSMEIFKSIGDIQDKDKKIFKLTTDLDFRGEDKADFKGIIDLGGAYFYGNGKTITCFEPYKIDDNNNSLSDFLIFKNAKGIYDLTIYLGSIKGNERAATSYAMFKNVETIDNVRVKGKLELAVDSQDFNIGGLVVGDYKSVTNCLVDYNVVLVPVNEFGESESLVTFGGIASENPYGSEIKNCVTNITFDGKYNSQSLIGGIVAQNKGFIEDCKTDFKINYTTYENNKTQIGGIVGNLSLSGEVKNCVANLNGQIIDNQNNSQLYGNVAVGGIAGVSYGSLFYNESKGNIEIKNIARINAGGLVGASKDSYILRNISKLDITISNAMKMFVANFVGSAMGGIIESSIAIGDVNVTLDYITDDIGAKNIGLFVFNSNNFIVDDPEDEFLTLNTIEVENAVGPSDCPSLFKNIIRGNTSIISVQSNDEPAGEEEEEDIETIENSMVNYGGYWWWLKRSDGNHPRLFSNSNCNGATITINGNDRTSSFFVEQSLAKAGLKNSNINISTQLKDYGLLSSEINSSSASSFDDLIFYNPASQQGSYYESEDQLVKDIAYCDGDKYFDHRVDSLYELTSISKYYKDSDKKRHLTFVVDKLMIVNNNNEEFVNNLNLIFAETFGEVVEKDETTKEYYLYSKAVKDTLLDNTSGKTLNEFLNTEMTDLVISDIEKIMVAVITEIANSKVQIYVDNNNPSFINIAYKVQNEETQRFYALEAVNDGDFYRITLFF